MTIGTERLELILLTPAQLRLWTCDLAALEKELGCSYRAEPIEGPFRQVVEMQRAAAEKDPGRLLWHSFFFLVRKSDRVVVGSADFKAPPDEEGQVEIGYGLGSEFEHNGYMTEAVRALCGVALGQPGIAHILAETDLDGYASQRILVRCGFKKIRQAETMWWKL